MSNPFTVLNNLEDTYYIAGTDYTFQYSVFDTTGSPLDITSCSCVLKLAWIGQPDTAVITIGGSIIDTNIFQAIVSASNTLNLSGKYIQQPRITDIDGTVYRPGQGIVTLVTGST